MIRAAYLLILQREPDVDAIAQYAERLGAGLTLENFLLELVASEEFERAHPSLKYAPELADVITRLAYGIILRRQPDEPAIAEWRRAFDQGRPWQVLVSELLHSHEFAELADREAAWHGLHQLWDWSLVDKMARLEAEVQRLRAQAMDTEAMSRRIAAIEDRLLEQQG